MGPPSIVGSDPNPLILVGLHIGASGVGSGLSIAVQLEGGELGVVTIRGVPPNRGNLGLFLVGRSHISSTLGCHPSKTVHPVGKRGVFWKSPTLQTVLGVVILMNEWRVNQLGVSHRVVKPRINKMMADMVE